MRAVSSVYKWFLIIILIVPAFGGYTQDSGLEPLRSILNQLQEKHGITFTYMDQTVDSLSLYPPNENLNLDKKLQYLEKEVGLQFTILNDEYISVRSKQTNTLICGYLLDAGNKSLIANAVVYAGDQFTTTDETGYFELVEVNSSENVWVSHLSYKKTLLNIDQNKGCQKYYLEVAISSLDEILIQSYIIQGIDKKSGGEMLVDLPQTSILPGLTEPDVFFLLQNLPGINSLNETVSDINIRGGSNDQNLILWNGTRLYQTGHFFGLISAINPHIIEKASLIKNGTSAKLGEGVSGTIQVETNNNLYEGFTLQAGSSLINTDQLLHIPINKTSITVASRQSFGGLVITPTYQKYFERAFQHSEVINQGSSRVFNSNEQFDFYDFYVDVEHEFSKDTKIRAGSLIMDNAVSYQESAVIDSKLTSKVSRLNQGSALGYLSFNHRWNNQLKAAFFGSVSDYEQKSVNFNVLTNQEHILENEVIETNLKLGGDYMVNEYWDNSIGLQFIETGIRNFRNINVPEFRSLSKEVIRTTSLFTENRINPFPNTEIVFGLRANYFDKIDRFRVEPRLSTIIRMGKSFSIELLGESKSQTVVQTVDFQTDFLGVEKRKWELINGEDIPLLTSSQGSLGLHYKRRSVLLSIEGFYKKVNGITTSSQGFLNQYQFIRSTGSYNSSGIELLINPSFGDFNSWFTYSFLNSDYSFPQLSVSRFRNNFDISHSISAGITYTQQNLELSTGVNYRSGLPFTGQSGIDQNDGTIIYNAPNDLTIDPYFRMDLSARYSFRISDKIKGKCGMSIWNLTNRENVINSYYTIQEGIADQISQLALGFTPNLNLRIIYSQ